MAKSKPKELAIVEDRSDDVVVRSADLIALMDAFECASEGQWPRVQAWLLEDYSMTEQELDARFKRLGKACRRTFGVL